MKVCFANKIFFISSKFGRELRAKNYNFYIIPEQILFEVLKKRVTWFNFFTIVLCICGITRRAFQVVNTSKTLHYRQAHVLEKYVQKVWRFFDYTCSLLYIFRIIRDLYYIHREIYACLCCTRCELSKSQMMHESIFLYFWDFNF